MKQTFIIFLFAGWFFVNPIAVGAQTARDSVSGRVTLEECINYALKNQPAVKQSLIDEEIGERNIKVALSGWFPEITGEGSLSHYIEQPTTVINNNGQSQFLRFGARNSSGFLLDLSQSIFDQDLILASRAARYNRVQNKQNTENTKINTIVNVSKAFFDILTSQEQVKILQENIGREEKQLKDAYAQYQVGVVDPTDYKRATITLSNSRAELKRTRESLNYKFAYLKQLMGYPEGRDLQLNFNGSDMEQQMLLDTTQQVNYGNRVEYRQLQTQKRLQNLDISYYRWGVLPSLSGFINRNWTFQSNQFSKLYDKAFPSAQTGLTLSIPIFSGTKRIQNLRIAQLQDRRLDLAITNTQNQISTQYQLAMASYKSSLNDWKVARENVNLSTDVYNTIKLQYNAGIKTYLDLMTAETDLRTTQINYLNALYSVLSSKIDVQQALGTIPINP